MYKKNTDYVTFFFFKLFMIPSKCWARAIARVAPFNMALHCTVYTLHTVLERNFLSSSMLLLHSVQ